MSETFNSVIDRIGAFNSATEKVSKGRAGEASFDIDAAPGWQLRLVRTDENYRIEVAAPGLDPAAADRLAAAGYAPDGEAFARPVRKSERSWNVADHLEEVLTDCLGLPSTVAITAP